MAELRMGFLRTDSVGVQDSIIIRALEIVLQEDAILHDSRPTFSLARRVADNAKLGAVVTPPAGEYLERLAVGEEFARQLAITFADAIDVKDTASKAFAETLTEAVTLALVSGPTPLLHFAEGVEIGDAISLTLNSPEMVRLYDLLPRVYRERDTEGFLRDFLWGFQKKLGEIYHDEKVLRVIQSIPNSPQRFLPYIAKSLGWKLQNTEPKLQKNECASIADYYDLKGTPYGIRLLSHLTLDKLFHRLMEFYTPAAESASKITTIPNDDLAGLLASNGDFVIPTWNNGISDYHYDPLYSYVVEARVDPSNYTYGEIRPRIKAFKNRIHTMHPAGRYCYPYIFCQGARTEDYKAISLVYEEITGIQTYDDTRFFDDGGRFDEADDPIDESLSTKFYKEWKTFDDEGSLDDEGFLDDGTWSVHGIFEIN